MCPYCFCYCLIYNQFMLLLSHVFLVKPLLAKPFESTPLNKATMLFSGWFLLIYSMLFVPLLRYQFTTLSFFELHNVNSLPAVVWYSGGLLTLIFFWFIGSRLTLTLTQLLVFCTFFPLVYLFVTTYNLLVLFVCYELFLLPSFLLVFFGSPNRRGVIAATYFLIWTSLGSFLVLLSIIGVFVVNKSFLYCGL